MSNQLYSQINSRLGKLSPREAGAVLKILEALDEAKRKWPRWVTDPIHAAAVLAEEAGETVQAANDVVYSGGSMDDVRKEAAQAGAVAIRVMAGRDYKCVGNPRRAR